MRQCTKCGNLCADSVITCDRCGNPMGTASSGSEFVRNYLGFIAMGMILLSLIPFLGWAIASNSNFLSAMMLRNILLQFCPTGIIALGVVVATRIKGPDLSMGSLMAMTGIIIAASASNGSLFVGIVLAFIVCCFYGLLNGTMISLLNIPSALLTLVTAASMLGAMLLISDYAAIPMSDRITQSNTLFIILFVIAAAIAVVALAITNRRPTLNKEKKNGVIPKLLDIIGYGLVAIIAGISGVAMLSRAGVATASMGTGYELIIIMVFAAVQSSKLLKNNLLALVYGLAVTLILTVYRTTLIFLALTVAWQHLVEANMVLLLLCAACAAQGGWRSVLGSNLSECVEKNSD